MRKYAINKELEKIAWIKAPSSVHAYPLANALLKLVPCRSDDKVTVKRFETDGYERGRVPVLVVEPKDCGNAILPCIVFYHGGGFMLRAAPAHYQIARWYAERARCKVILPDYRLAPKHRFPYAPEDCYAAYRWVLDNADDLRVDPDRMIAAGDSAGGNLAAAVTLMLWDRMQITPSGVLLVYPVLDRRMQTTSMQKYQDTPLWDAKLTSLMWDEYLVQPDRARIPYASPMEAVSLLHFPDVYIEVAEFDSLHDEGVAFAERLRASGVSVDFHDIKGACHGFETALKSTIVRDAVQRRIQWIESVFRQRP